MCPDQRENAIGAPPFRWGGFASKRWMAPIARAMEHRGIEVLQRIYLAADSRSNGAGPGVSGAASAVDAGRTGGWMHADAEQWFRDCEQERKNTVRACTLE